MRPSALLVTVVLMVTSPLEAAPAPAAPVTRAAGEPSVTVQYREPRNPAHQQLYREMRQRHFLEQLAEVIAVVRLPKPLTLIFVGCDGISNAFYEEKYNAIVFCYELLADIRRAATANRMTDVVSMEDAKLGPVVFVLLHEAGHAVFDLLHVPIFGREEDAADHYAAMMLLEMGKGRTLRLLGGAAWAYGHAARGAKPGVSDYADIHSLDSQRFYNIACLMYGSDPQFFASLVTDGYLPQERAERCEKEYHQALHAMQVLIWPHIDKEQDERLRAKYYVR